MTDDQLAEVKSDIKALTTQINWLVDDVDTLKTEIGDVKALLITMMEVIMEGGGAAQPKESNWKVEKL
jgi:predicted  nucleic acid-binding Zn-ribbon protein